MKIAINDSKEITDYVIIGLKASCVIEVEDEIVPADFKSKFKPGYYIYISGAIVENKNYVTTIPEEPKRPLTDQDKINAELFKMNLDLKKQLEELKSNE
ncbi:DUF2977 domain-containing protein [Latilactobacillus sakei]|uniref:DUF2977 domain-containing protein n=1 Tax=Latilactobacillus sakei TaxID=1599 RepID=UPI0020C7B5AC|nr:DUF2977 domain-containing protein [Latilactobacillus sakei]MCP8851746.1 DUF2977 domain-containing protein [Latilactobacillus sakei]